MKDGEPLSPEEQEERQRARLRRERELAQVRFVMSAKSGRAFMWRLLQRGGVYAMSFAGELTHQTAFAEGQRNLGNFALAEIMEACPEQYILMAQEAKEDA